MIFRIHVEEKDGYPRRSFPSTLRTTFARSDCPSVSFCRLLDPERKEVPLQIVALESWEDGSLKEVDLTFAPFVAPRATAEYLLDTHATEPAEARLRNPVSVTEHSDHVTVSQGPLAYTVRRSGFTLVDSVISNGRPFLRAGTPGPLLVLEGGEALAPDGPVDIQTESRGPWAGTLRVQGRYPNGVPFLTRLTFVPTKSWFEALHWVSPSDGAEIQCLRVESQFDLPDGEIRSAFGARENNEGTPTSWAVVTDGVRTVDIAALSAWTRDDQVRFESGPDGCFAAVYPYHKTIPSNIPTVRTFYHFLNGPPDDIKNTPAAAMAAELVCRIEPDASLR